nr:hypothetical protein [uncultured bacterium]
MLPTMNLVVCTTASFRATQKARSTSLTNPLMQPASLKSGMK